ncbi:MAG: DNA-processing protein DprA [Bacteroidales bacterium]|nr:DNA-processing protein DprA [Bacteroidales bacterium]
MNDELQYLIALTSIRGIGAVKARLLTETFGSARAVLEAEDKSLKVLQGVGQCILQSRGPELMKRAEQEMRFMDDHHIRPMILGQAGYPRRLQHCPDAPMLLYRLGNADLDSAHTISIVGTRACTQYGRDMVARLLADMKAEVPDLVVMSGLAFGIDISAHQAALDLGIPTVGVVAHGLDRIYPSMHRRTAAEMIDRGGAVVTEYMTGTEPIAGNFLARNRIIAGLSDAVVVAESREKGGSLVTASIAIDYNREVYAFPGRVGDDRSKGCNRLIRLNRAALITSAKDMLESLGWISDKKKATKAVQTVIPFDDPNLSPNGQRIVTMLRQHGDLRLSQLRDLTGMEQAQLLEELLALELEDHIRNCPGGLYQLK